MVVSILIVLFWAMIMYSMVAIYQIFRTEVKRDGRFLRRWCLPKKNTWHHIVQRVC
jgi:hypothetical protein